MSQARRSAALLLALGVSLGVAGCGGTGSPTSTAPTSKTPSASPTPSATPPPTASATPTARPLSRFEDDPAVQGARAWAAAISQDINAGNRRYPNARRLTTPANRKNLDAYAAEDIGKKMEYPGPVPFTPVRVRTSGAKETLTTCMWTKGWGLDRTTHRPNEKRGVIGVDIVMQKAGDGWRVGGVVQHPINCAQVSVKGIPW